MMNELLWARMPSATTSYVSRTTYSDGTIIERRVIDGVVVSEQVIHD